MDIFGMTFWRAIFLIGLTILLILKYRDRLDITKLLPAGLLGIIFSLIGNIALVKLHLISYNPAKLASPIFGVSLFQQLSSGLITIIAFHFLPNKFSRIALYLASVSVAINFVVYLAQELKVIRFLKWGYIQNFLFDFVALLLIYSLYELLKKKYSVTT